MEAIHKNNQPLMEGIISHENDNNDDGDDNDCDYYPTKPAIISYNKVPTDHQSTARP